MSNHTIKLQDDVLKSIYEDCLSRSFKMIQTIHCYLCYYNTKFFSPDDREILRRQNNMLFFTMRLVRRLWNAKVFTICTPLGQKQRVFIAYLLCIKWVTDATMWRPVKLARMFNIHFYYRIADYEWLCLQELDFSFKVLEEPLVEWPPT